MYKIKLTKIATENLEKIDRKTRYEIVNKIESLKEEPKLLGRSLKGPLKEFRSIRAAGQRYRIIYKAINEEIVMIIIAVGIRKEGDRKDIYGGSFKMLFFRASILGSIFLIHYVIMN